MSNSSMTTELDEILTSIDDSEGDLSFFMGVMKDLNIELSEYTPEQAALIQKSQKCEISEAETALLENILRESQSELENQEDMVRAYLSQCNREKNLPKLMIH